MSRFFPSLLVDRTKQTLRELALDAMRPATVDLHAKPGKRLAERNLCAQLGVNRTEVREMLRRLHPDGLVATPAGWGPIVAEVLEIPAAVLGAVAGSAADGGAEGDATPAADWHLRVILAIPTLHCTI